MRFPGIASLPLHATDRKSLERICRVSYLRGGGPGGQHRNKTETGVRILI